MGCRILAFASSKKSLHKLKSGHYISGDEFHDLAEMFFHRAPTGFGVGEPKIQLACFVVRFGMLGGPFEGLLEYGKSLLIIPTQIVNLGENQSDVGIVPLPSQCHADLSKCFVNLAHPEINQSQIRISQDLFWRQLN